MTTIKFCGIRREEDIEFLNQVLPEYAGFIFDSTRSRYVAPDRVAILRKMLDPRVHTVGVFVDAGMLSIVEIVQKCNIDVVQLHGEETDDYVKKLKKSLRRTPVIKAFRIRDAADVAKANASSADYVLVDSGNGGTGRTFDWNLLSGLTRPVILAGGLTPENVGEAIEKVNPIGVDVSSGVETDGLKDLAKMRTFVANVRKYNQE